MGEDVNRRDGIQVAAVLGLLVFGIALREFSRNVLALDTELFTEARHFKDLLCAATYFSLNLLSVACFGVFVLYAIGELEKSRFHPYLKKGVSVVLLVCVLGTAFWTLFTPDALLYSVYENSVDENKAAFRNVLQVYATATASGQ